MRLAFGVPVEHDEVHDYPKLDVRPLETAKRLRPRPKLHRRYLWSLYERTPKVDTNKVTEKVKKTVKKKGKMRTVFATFTKYVLGDFTWKDPIAAEKAGMPMKDYVIGGMDRGFKLKLYRALRAIDDAGFMPGITSAFRDDYRQASPPATRRRATAPTMAAAAAAATATGWRPTS